MPIKVRCRGCQAVLNAPDKARGKTLRCPHCQTAVKIPAGGGAGAGGAAGAGGSAAPAKRRRAPAGARTAPAGDEDFIANLDLSRVEDRRARVCPKCGFAVPEDDDECPKCGTDIETGRLTAAARKRIARRGAPDPARFYKEAWSNPWDFLTNNLGLAVKTGFIMAFFAILAWNASFFANWSTGLPPKAFWWGVMFVANLGGPGWYLFLTTQTIEATLAKKNEVKESKFDFFSAVALGVRMSIWPYVLVLPFFWFPPAWLLPLLVFPIAMVHMSRTYTYKAWLPWEMTKIWAKNIGPSLYWLMMVVLVGMPAVLLIGAVLLVTLFTAGQLLPVDTVTNIAEWIKGLIHSSSELKLDESWLDRIYFLMAINVFLIPFIIFVSLVSAFPSVFLMRVIGLFAYYNRPTLELVDRTTPNEPAGFGPRYLAYLVDLLILGIIGGGLYGLVFLLALGAASLDLIQREPDGSLGGPLAGTLIALERIVLGVISLIPLGYYIKSEAGEGGQAMLGKWALGLVVVDMKNEPISRKVASQRVFARAVSGLTLGIGYLMAIWHEKKQTLHDQMTDTQVVWRGDE